MEGYTTIAGLGTFEYEDRKSVFIGLARPVSTEEEALGFLGAVKKKYPDARHHVYAYVLRENGTTRFSDDHEPQGTAGMPVLDAIRKRGLTDVAIVVVRYFGGTLLGTGGLVRAYTEAAVGALDAGRIVTLEVCLSCEISLSYAEYQRFLPLAELHGFRVEDTEYSDGVKIFGCIRKDLYDAFEKALCDMAGGRELASVTGEKFSY